jgi:hypothetical protein
MSAAQVETLFGRPEGRSGRTSARLDAAVQAGWLRKTNTGGEGAYSSTGAMPGRSEPEPTWVGIGRDAPRVASVFDLAGGVVR